MLFTGNNGKKYGYNDGWKGEFFYYYGEGQIGDMEFKRGNKAIKNHILDNYELHLFKNISNGCVKYIWGNLYMEVMKLTKGTTRKEILEK
jgi:5-methylcytosine-specific restriction protein A